MTGRIEQMDFESYKALDAANAHGLSAILRSPAHFHYERTNTKDPTPQQRKGTLGHMATLELDEYMRRVTIPPEVNKRTTAGKALLAAFEATRDHGAVVATQEEHSLAIDIFFAVHAQPYARALLADGQAERTLIWTDEEHGVQCKARADWLCSGHAVIVDLKTARDASYEAFKRACSTYRYHLQAAWYREAAHRCGLGERAFVFVVVESEPPHGVALYQLDEQAMHVGWIQAREALAVYAECKRTGEWPSYPKTIQQLTLPPWATR